MGGEDVAPDGVRDLFKIEIGWPSTLTVMERASEIAQSRASTVRGREAVLLNVMVSFPFTPSRPRRASIR